MIGKLLVLTGVDGCGKSTQYENLKDWLKKNEYSFKGITFSPRKRENYSIYHDMKYGLLDEGIEMPADIRSIILAFDTYVQICTELMDALNSYDIVVTDRYIESTIIYLKARGIDSYWPYQILKKAPNPDLYLYIDTKIDTCIERVYTRKKKRQSHETPEIMKCVQKIFNESMDQYGFVRVNGNGTENEVFSRIIEILRDKNII